MKLGITYKLFLAILAAAVMSVAGMFLIMQWDMDRGFLRYVNTMEQRRMSLLAQRLEESYAEKRNWSFLSEGPDYLRKITMESWPDEAPPPGPGWDRVPPPPGGADVIPPPGGPAAPGRPPHPDPAGSFVMRVYVLDAGKKPLAGTPDAVPGGELRTLRNNGKVVGYLGLTALHRLSDTYQLHFLKQQKLDLGIFGAVVLLMAGGLSLPLANRLLRPIRALAAATGRLSAGDFATRVTEHSADEIGQLARDFNVLALTLEKNEQSRRQWVADISHELRTPLTILRGEIEALQDGISSPTPEAINSLHGEVLHLARLVDDLYHLSLSDLGALTYHMEELDLAELLAGTLGAFRPEFSARDITVMEDIDLRMSAVVFGDRERLRQLFTNLFDNSLKYTRSGGKLEVRMSCEQMSATVDIQDSAPGVADSDLGRLFDRLYRVESSRSRSAGGAGLGLAICRNIVEAHCGTIEALVSPIGGVWIRIEIPFSEVR
jgi:two-component system sensor histidine kinase BaeS